MTPTRLAMALALAGAAAPQLHAQQQLYPVQRVLSRGLVVSADTNFLSDPLTGGDGKHAVTYEAEITVVGDAASLMLVIDPDGSGAQAALDPVNLSEDGADLEPGRKYTRSWKAFKGESYQLQMSEATTIHISVVELTGAVSVAGLRRSSGGGLSTVSTTGDGLSGDGTAGSPLAVAADLENLVDTATVSASGHVTLTGRQQAIDYGGGVATLSSLVSISVAAGQAGTRTITLFNDATGSGAISVDTAGLSASETRHVLVVITDSGGPHDLEFPGDWKWTNADGAPTATVASGVHFLWLQSWGATDSTVMATWIEAQ